MQTIKKDIIIVGAGLLGSSVAMHLSKQGTRSIAVVDLDLEGVFSSSEVNAGGVRATWNNPVNAEVSKVSIQYYSQFKEEVGFRQKGYFWMFSKEAWSQAQAALKANPNLRDLEIEYLYPPDITRRFPFIDKTQDLGGATFSPQDGVMNPNLLKLHYRKIAKQNGVEFLDRIWVHHVQSKKEIELETWCWPENLSHEELKKILSEKTTTGAETLCLKTQVLINCSGAWARRFAKCMNVECPSQPLRRQMSLFECKDVDLTPYGMFVDPTGVYFHSEANMILAGYATPDEKPGYNFEYEGEEFFEKNIWPALYERSTKFENLKHVTGWAGLYEVSPDKSAMIGKVPGFENVFEAHSFSGRGAMQSYGAGLGLSELILQGQYKTIDLSSLNGSRFITGKLLSEGLLI